MHSGVIAAKACATASGADPRRPAEAVSTVPGVLSLVLRNRVACCRVERWSDVADDQGRRPN